MVGLVIVLCLSVLTIVGWIQIITKAGYSPWWVLVPLSLPVLWLISTFLLYSDFNGLGTYGAYNLGPGGGGRRRRSRSFSFFLDVIFNFIMFLAVRLLRLAGHASGAVETHAEHRCGRSADRRAAFPGPGSGPGQAPGAVAGAAPPTPFPATESGPGAQAPGWYQSGALGAGEQSYPDGSAWTARRRWSRGGLDGSPHGARRRRARALPV